MKVISPPLHRGMVELERSAFKKLVPILAIKVPSKNVGVVMKSFSTDLFNLPRYRNVLAAPDSKDSKIVLLRSDLNKIEDLGQEKIDLIKKENLSIIQHKVQLDYDYWTAEQILHAVMPEDFTDVPASFTQVGHIAHMNLREHYYPWKHLIGQVILDKNKNITTVVNKTSNIDATFRFFKMELLAGEDNMIAEVRESNCRFKFDFSKVYWNSRLHTEHDRLIQQFKPNDYVCDVFAGVGPFALPAAKRGAIVYANDLNPTSSYWMKENIKLNKITQNIEPYNMDGRAFIQQAVKDLQATSNEWKTFQHFVMNLPATAIEFLDSFRGLYADQKHLFKEGQSQLPIIHCHCFTKSSDPKQDISERIGQVMGASPDLTKSHLHWVRNVAPKKDMYCISFPLSPEVAFESNKRKLDTLDKETTKVPRIDE